MMRSNWKILIVATCSFALGFFAHREQAHEPIRVLLAYLTGGSGGCDIPSLLRARARSEKLARCIDASRHGVRLIEEAADGFGRWDTPLGQLWCPPRDSPAYVVGEQMAEVYTEGSMALSSDDVVLDCGANIGDFVRTCLRAGVAKVVAIDPSPNNVEAMRRSFSGEITQGKVVVVPKGVWHEDATMKMTLYESSALNSFVMRDRKENRGRGRPREIELPVTTIDRIVEELKLEKVTFLKMDIEGAERNALRGAVNTIKRFRPRMALATENLDDDYIAVPGEVQKLGLDYAMKCGLCRRLGPTAFRPDILFFTPR